MTANASGEIRALGDWNVSCSIRPISLVGYVVGAGSSSSDAGSETSRLGMVMT